MLKNIVEKYWFLISNTDFIYWKIKIKTYSATFETEYAYNLSLSTCVFKNIRAI